MVWHVVAFRGDGELCGAPGAEGRVEGERRMREHCVHRNPHVEEVGVPHEVVFGGLLVGLVDAKARRGDLPKRLVLQGELATKNPKHFLVSHKAARTRK